MNASSGLGIEQARRFTPSPIPLDLVIPGMTGGESVAASKAGPVAGDIPAVAVTADVHTSAAPLEQGGFCAFVGKPIRPRQPIDAVAQCLAHREAAAPAG